MKRRNKSLRAAHLYSQESHQNAKLGAIIHTQGTWHRPCACCLSFLAMLIRGPCFPGVLHPPGSCVPSSSSSKEFPESQGEGIDGEIPLRTECSWSLTLCPMSGCGSLVLLPSAAEGSFYDDR